MSAAERGAVRWKLPSAYSVSPARSSGRPRRRSAPAPEHAPVAFDVVLSGLREEGLAVVDDVVIESSEPGRPRRRRAAAPAAVLELELGPREDAVVLVERDGVLSWHFAHSVAAKRSATRGGADAVRRATFRIPLAEGAPSEERRGILDKLADKAIDVVVGKARAVVFKFAAGIVAGHAIRFLERGIEPGLVALPVGGEMAELGTAALPARAPRPAGRPPRVLVLIPGTFGGVTGAFGPLTLYPWGRELLRGAHERYDEVIGYEHRTLSEDPLANAADLLERLEARYGNGGAVALDVVAYSRGGLVARALTEQLLPVAPFRPQLRRLVLVACPNAGTPLAEPENWNVFIDFYTNLASALAWALSLIPQAKAPAEIGKAIIKGIGAFVKYLASASLDETAVPGLAAMQPDGKFLRGLNARRPGPSRRADLALYAVAAAFEPRVIGGDHEPKDLPARLVQAVADGLADQLMHGEDNDLVVDTPSMMAVDPAVGAPFADVLDFGRTPYVHHLSYFSRPTVAAALARWLGLDEEETTPEGVRVARGVVAPELPGVVETAVVAVAADDEAEEVLAAITAADPAYVVVGASRSTGAARPRLYAYSTEEVLTSLGGVEPNFTVGAALPADHRPSAVFDGVGAVSGNVGGPNPEPASRAVVMAGEEPIGVIPEAPQLDNGGLAELALELTRPAETAAVASRRRRLMPEVAPPRRGRPRRGTRGVRGAGARAAKPAQTHVRAEMPTEIVAGKVGSVTVTLSREALAAVSGTAEAAGAFTVADANRPLIVQCVAKQGVEVVSEDRFELAAPEPDTPAHLYFDVKGVAAGPAEVWVMVRQGPTPLVTLELDSVVVKRRSSGAARVRRSEAAAFDVREECPLRLKLDILERAVGNATTYQFIVYSNELGINLNRDSEPIEGDRETYVADIYNELEQRWISNRDDIEAFAQELADYGGALLDELVPQVIQRALWEHRDAIDGILVQSEEPFIPWEIVHLKGPDGTVAGGTFLGALGLTRWLWKTRQGRGPLHQMPPCALRVRDGRARYIAPAYADPDLVLDALAAESEMLESRFGATPVTPHIADVREVLAGPAAFDLLHFAGHGEAAHDDIRSAHILLQGRYDAELERVDPRSNGFAEERLNVSAVSQNAVLSDGDGAAPMVVLNACRAGRLGRQLTSIGGFAEAFLGKGAGAFVSSLWAVGDQPALGFVDAFYEALLDGKTTAEAVRSGRARAREDGDATWAAYVVYAHPAARLLR